MGRPRGTGRPIQDRFWPKVAKSIDGCWNWTAVKWKNGYGFIGRGGAGAGNIGAHRLSWELEHGPIPEGLDVCHRCDNRSCVRPDHLFLGTAKQNMEDCVSKGRMHRGERTGSSKLTAHQVKEIRRCHSLGDTLTALGRAFDVTQGNVRSIVKRETWAHV